MAIFLGLIMQSLLGDEDVWSGRLEFRLKRAITFDLTFGSRSYFLYEFREAVFFGIAMQSLFGDEEFWSARLEYWVKSALTFDPTVGSHSNFYMSFWRLFSWRSYAIVTR
jgi:hypothetical protein